MSSNGNKNDSHPPSNEGVGSMSGADGHPPPNRGAGSTSAARTRPSPKGVVGAATNGNTAKPVNTKKTKKKADAIQPPVVTETVEEQPSDQENCIPKHPNDSDLSDTDEYGDDDAVSIIGSDIASIRSSDFGNQPGRCEFPDEYKVPYTNSPGTPPLLPLHAPNRAKHQTASKKQKTQAKSKVSASKKRKRKISSSSSSNSSSSSSDSSSSSSDEERKHKKKNKKTTKKEKIPKMLLKPEEDKYKYSLTEEEATHFNWYSNHKVPETDLFKQISRRKPVPDNIGGSPRWTNGSARACEPASAT